VAVTNVCPDNGCYVAGSCNPSTGRCTTAEDGTLCNTEHPCTPDGDRCVAGTCLPQADVCTLASDGSQYLPIIEINKPGKEYSYAYDINDNGVVVGGSADYYAWGDWGTDGFIWSEPGLDPIVPDPSTPFPAGFNPRGINNEGVISGTAFHYQNSSGLFRSFRFDPRTQPYPEIFGNSAGRGINSYGIMTGCVVDAAGLVAFTKDDGPMQVIPEVPGPDFDPIVAVQGIDDDGDLVGYAVRKTTDPNPPWGSTAAAFRYSKAREVIEILDDLIPGSDTSWQLRWAYASNGHQIVGGGVRNDRKRAFRMDFDGNDIAQVPVELPLPGDWEEMPASSVSGIAHDINSNGDIAGAVYDNLPTWPLAAVVWLDGVPYDLNDYINDPHWVLRVAQAINNRRPDGSFDVVGYGDVNGKSRAFKMRVPNLRPCPAPDGECLISKRDLSTGLCRDVPTDDGATCDDGDVCTSGDSCRAGQCSGAEDLSCAAAIELAFEGMAHLSPSQSFAIFSYTNHSSENQNVPYGSENHVSMNGVNGADLPNPDRRIPEWFKVRTHGVVVPWHSTTTSMSWTVGDETVSADNSQIEVIETSEGRGVTVGGEFIVLDPVDSSILAASVVATDFITAPDGTKTAGGTLSGALSVSADGAAEYVIPFQLPPGRAGLQPRLALQYNSRKGNGSFGVGWSLTGLSAITRCNKKVTYGEVADAIRFDGTDPFCWNGVRLRGIRPGNNAAMEFRTEEESYARIMVPLGATDAAGPVRFQVETVDGLIHHFHAVHSTARVTPVDEGGEDSPDYSQITSHFDTAAPVRLSWLLTETRDRNGNSISYDYTTPANVADPPPTPATPEAAHAEEALLSRVRYNDDQVEIRFDYEARPDPSYSYVSGVRLSDTVRCTSITVNVPITGEVVRRYRLAYSNTKSISKRSLLTSVRECDRSDVCKRPTEFEWTGGAQQFADHIIENVPVETTWGVLNNPPVYSLSAGDFNGDGLDDIVFRTALTDLERNEIAWVVRLGTGSGFGPAQVIDINEDNSAFIQHREASEIRVSDLNMDGRADIVVRTIRPVNQGNVTHYMYFWQMFLSRGDGTFDGPAGMVSGINDWSLGTAHIGDFNGDGVPDFVSETSPPEGDVIEGSWWDVDYGDGTGKTVRFSGFGVKLSTPELPTSLLPVPVSIIDTTGSGAASLLTPVWYENPSPSTVKPRLRDGTQSWSNLRMRITGEFDTFLPGDETRDVYNYFGDINGDGLLDALTWVPPHIWLGGWGLQPRALVNAGTGFLAPQVPNLVAIPPTETEAALGASKRYKILTLDWDQDARDDFLIVDTSPHNSPQRPFPTILVSRPDGFEVVSPPGMPETLVHSSSHNLSLDANGDGLTDLLLDHFPAVPGELLRLWVRVGGRADLLSSVTNGLGATETVEYSPMTRASGIYTPGDCSAPTYCVTRGPLAVSTVRHDPGRVGARTDRYQYADARIGLKGRGWLGVGRRFFHQVENNVQTTSTFGISDFDGTRYPKAGKLLEEHTQAGTLSFLTTNTYETSPRGDGVFAVRLMGRTQRKWQGGGQTTILSQIDETFEYDFAGALERRESVTSDGYSSVEVYRDTVNDFANWIIHRPTRIETTETDPQGRTETRVRETRYDDRGSVTDTLVEPDEATDPESEVYSRTHFDYSSLGVVRQITTSDAADAERVTTFRLSPGELYPREIVDPEGHVSRQILHPAYGSAVWESDRNGVTTTRTVDAFGRQKFERRAGTAFRSWKYLPGRVGSAEGVTLEQRELLGPTRLTSVDHRGRPIIEAHVDDTGNWSIVDTEYEGAGLNVVTQSRPHAENQSALRSRYEYDNLGRLVRFVPAGDNGYFTRDFFGRTIALRDAKGGFSVTRLDDLGRTIENTAYRDLAPLATPITTTYQYSVFGTLRRIALPGEANVSIGYDKLGRRTSLVDPDAGESIFHYNGFGDLVSRTDGNENVETMQPDRLGRTVLRTSDDGEQRFDWDHAENGFGKLAGTSTQPAGSSQEAVSQTFGYDAFGRPERASFRIGADSYSIRSEFDGQGRLSVVHYPSRGSTALAVRYAYNPHTGLLGLVSDADVPETEFWRALERDGEGRVTRWRLGNGVVETASYDVLGRLEAIGATNDTAHGITALRYDYDLVGNVESRTDDILETTETFGYDGLQRLTHWNYSAGVGEWGIRYPYENNGNLKGRIVEMGNGDSLDFVYGQNGAGPHAITTSHLGGYSYDGAGRQTSAPGRPLVTYDMRGLPRSVQRSNGGEVIFSYGAGGERARKRAGDTTTTYVGALYEHRESGSSSHEVLSVLAGGRKIAEIRRSSGAIEQVVSYFHRDRLGSTIAVTDESGGMVERTAYDPFGRRFDHNVSPLVDAAPLSSTTVGFAELEEDPEVDLINMNARLYDPNTGRFISPDPLVGELLDAQTFNRYSYARNNPVTLADPTGLDPYIQISSGSASEPSFNPFGSLLSAALGILTSWTGGGGEAAAPISAPALSGTTTSMGAVTRQAVLTPVADSQDNRAAAVLEWNQINEHAYLLDKAPFDMSETVKMLRDDLIQRVLKLYSIDPSGFEVVYTPNVKAHDLKGKDEVTVAITNSILRTIGIGPREFDSISKLAGSVFHETRHARQAADFNVGASGEVGGALNELEAYLLTLKNADTLGLDIGEIWQARAQAEEYYWILTFDPGYMRQLDGYPPSFDVRTLERMELDMWREIHLLVEAVDRRLSR
jgi:RHS repeat-associated protein